MTRGTNDKDSSCYPYPILDWTDESAYLGVQYLDAIGWAWEFLRRNSEYQRLWDLFDSLPDFIEGVDETGPYNTNKNGKWKGTCWDDFRFLEDGAGWYADPPPLRGESIDEYRERCPQGEVLPFAHYLEKRFSIIGPVAPRSSNPPSEFDSVDPDKSMPPRILELEPPAPVLCEHFPSVYPGGFLNGLDAIARDPLKVPVLFDLRYPIEPQINVARDMLKDALRSAESSRQRVKGVHFRPNDFAMYIRLLDAVAAGASLGDIADRCYPGEPNAHPDFPVSDRIKKQVNRGKYLTYNYFFIACKEAAV